MTVSRDGIWMDQKEEYIRWLASSGIAENGCRAVRSRLAGPIKGYIRRATGSLLQLGGRVYRIRQSTDSGLR